MTMGQEGPSGQAAVAPLEKLIAARASSRAVSCAWLGALRAGVASGAAAGSKVASDIAADSAGRLAANEVAPKASASEPSPTNEAAANDAEAGTGSAISNGQG